MRYKPVRALDETVTVATDGNYTVVQMHDSVALFCTGGKYAHETPMYITDVKYLKFVVINMHHNADMMGLAEAGE